MTISNDAGLVFTYSENLNMIGTRNTKSIVFCTICTIVSIGTQNIAYFQFTII